MTQTATPWCATNQTPSCACAINISMYHLLSYRHGYREKWDRVMPIPWKPNGKFLDYLM